MLIPHVGAGPLRFRYWAGLYRKGGSRLSISSGVGNWFPVRINAPPEIVHLTLRRAEDRDEREA
jgi:predicted MPP superfamily phosphohydrolase